MKARLEIPLSLKEAAQAMGASTSADGTVNFITTDSRELENDGLFFALGRGEDFVNHALSRGFAVSSENKDALLVPDTRAAFLSLAAYYKRKLPKLKTTVAITGSVGKTTIKDYTGAILSSKYKVHKTPGNFNNEIGLPLSIFSAPLDTEVLVLEMGMNAPREIERLSHTASPDIAIITNIGTSHIGKLGTRENIALAKREILLGLKCGGAVIIPSDEPLLSDIKSAFKLGVGTDVNACDIRESSSGIFYKILTPLGKTEEIHFPWGGTHLAKNLAFAVSAALCTGFDLQDINNAISDISVFIPRQNYIKIKNLFFYNDSYNASLESYIADFKMLRKRGTVFSAVIGDILELGEEEKKIHKRLGELSREFGLSKIYPFGKNALTVLGGALSSGFPSKNIFINENSHDYEGTARLILDNSAPGEIILIKGSHALHTEKIIEAARALSDTD